MTPSFPRLRILLASLSLVASMAAHAEPSIPVRFDERSQTLSISPTQAMLSQLLREISRQSGVEIRLDPKEDRQVDIALKQQPVDEALLSLARQNQLNFVMGHVRESDGRQRLVSFAVLREGGMSAENIPPLDISNEPKPPTMGELRKQKLQAEPSMADGRKEKKELSAAAEERKQKRQAAREAEKANEQKERKKHFGSSEDELTRIKARHDEEMARLKKENPKLWAKRQAKLDELRRQRAAKAAEAAAGQTPAEATK